MTSDNFHHRIANNWCYERLTEGCSTEFDAIRSLGRCGLYSEDEMREHFSYDLYNYTSYLVDEGEIKLEDHNGVGVLEVQLFSVGKRYYFTTTLRE